MWRSELEFGRSGFDNRLQLLALADTARPDRHDTRLQYPMPILEG